MITILAIYVVGLAAVLWRADAAPRSRLVLAVLWPLGPLAFVLTVALLVAASVIAFPLVGLVAAAGVVTWWVLA